MILFKKCALPQTHLPFKLSETRRKNSTSLFPASAGAMTAGPGLGSALHFPPSDYTFSSDCRLAWQCPPLPRPSPHPQPQLSVQKWKGRRQRPQQVLCQSLNFEAACQPPHTPLKTKTLSIKWH